MRRVPQDICGEVGGHASTAKQAARECVGHVLAIVLLKAVIAAQLMLDWLLFAVVICAWLICAMLVTGAVMVAQSMFALMMHGIELGKQRLTAMPFTPAFPCEHGHLWISEPDAFFQLWAYLFDHIHIALLST